MIISSCKRKKDTIKDQKKPETGCEMLLLRIDKIDVLLQIYMVIFVFLEMSKYFCAV